MARANDMAVCALASPIPHVGGPLVLAAPVQVEAAALPVARMGDYSLCADGTPNLVATGAKHVLVHGLPLAYVGCLKAHGGTVSVSTNATVFVGGPNYTVPANMRILGPPEFQNQTLRDLFLLSATPTGAALLQMIEATNKPVSIVPESNPFNSYACPLSPPDAENGVGTGSEVKYNPKVAVVAYDDKGNRIPCPPQLVLGHELIHVLHFAHGQGATHGPDPNSPASQPNMPLEESQTIGTGTFQGTPITENQLRAEMGLGRRDNHLSETTDLHGNPFTAPPLDMRPGGY